MKRPHESLYQDLTRTYRSWQVFITSDHTVPPRAVDVILAQPGRHDFAFDDLLLLHRLLRLGLFVSRFRIQSRRRRLTSAFALRPFPGSYSRIKPPERERCNRLIF